MLPPDEANQNFWKKITKSIFSKFFKRFFSNDMIEVYLGDTIRAMFHEIYEMQKNDPRLQNFKCAKKYMISIYNSLVKSIKQATTFNIAKVFFKMI